MQRVLVSEIELFSAYPVVNLLIVCRDCVTQSVLEHALLRLKLNQPGLQTVFFKLNYFKLNNCYQFPLAPMGVLTPGSAHA